MLEKRKQLQEEIDRANNEKREQKAKEYQKLHTKMVEDYEKAQVKQGKFGEYWKLKELRQKLYQLKISNNIKKKVEAICVTEPLLVPLLELLYIII